MMLEVGTDKIYGGSTGVYLCFQCIQQTQKKLASILHTRAAECRVDTGKHVS